MCYRSLCFLSVLLSCGCAEQANEKKPQASAAPSPVLVVNEDSRSDTSRGNASAELAELASGKESVDLWAEEISPDELRRLPMLPHLKELSFRKLKVQREHLDVVVEKCPNLERFQVFEAVVVPELFGSLPKLKSLTMLDVLERTLNDAALEPLRGLPLTQLVILNTAVTDEGMKVVGTLTNLENFNGIDLSLTDAGIEALQSLSKLKSLSLYNSKITDASLKIIGRMQDLTDLGLNGTLITDAGMAELASLKKLKIFDAHRTGLTDRGLEVMVQWPEIETLSLWDLPISDAGLKILSGAKTLRHLHIGRTMVTDSGLPHLYGMSLKVLNLSDTETTPLGIAKLKETIPGLEVYKYGQLQ